MPEMMDTQETRQFWSEWWDQMEQRRRIEEEIDNRRRRKATWFFIVVRSLTCLGLVAGIVRVARAAHTFVHPAVFVLLSVVFLVGLQLSFNVKDLKRYQKK